MEKARLWAVEWEQGDETLTALEPTDDELRRAAPELAASYNDGSLTCRDFLASYVRGPAQAWLQGDTMKITPLN